MSGYPDRRRYERIFAKTHIVYGSEIAIAARQMFNLDHFVLPLFEFGSTLNRDLF